MLLALLAVPALFAGVRAVLRRGPRAPQQVVFSPDPGELPALAAEIPRLRVFAWRAVGIAMLWLIPIAGGTIGASGISGAARHLLDTGTRVTGTVVAESTPYKGAWSIDVRYPVAGSEHTATITLGPKRGFTAGQLVTVIVDPADPGRVRTEADGNTSGGLMALCIGSAIVGSVGVLGSWAAVARWHRRHAAVRRTGWRSASVSVTRMPKRRAVMTVRYPGGESSRLCDVFSSHVAPKAPAQAWVGGGGKAMVVLFARPGKRPLAVPAMVWPAKNAGLG